MGIRDTARLLVMRIVIKLLQEVNLYGDRGIDSETLFLKMKDEISFEDFTLAINKLKGYQYIDTEEVPIMNLHLIKINFQGKIFLKNCKVSI